MLTSNRALSSTPVTAQQQTLPLLLDTPRNRKPAAQCHSSNLTRSAAVAAAAGAVSTAAVQSAMAAVLQPQLQQQQHLGLLHQQQQCRSRTHKAACSAAAAVQAAGDSLLNVDATPFIGPIQVVNIEGAGRGVVVTRDVAPGELLLCCHPLAVVTGAQQQALTVDQLQVQLAVNISPALTSWLNTLYDGTSASLKHLPDLQAAAAAQQQQPLLASLRHHGSNGSSGSNGGAAAVPAVTDALLQHIMDVVRYNAYSDLHDDLAAAAAAGQEPVALIGLYPEFSFFNHSCVPNCINWVLPGEPRAMVVRAARAIPAGSQATISYLGGPQLLPLDGRQQALGNFGFVCRCPRCVVEEEVPADVAELLEDVVSRTFQSFKPRLASSASGDAAAAAAAEVRCQASGMMTLLYNQFRRHLVRPNVRQQLLASCFSCLEVIADAAAAEGDGPGTAESLQRCLAAAAAVTLGSDLHCITAAKLEAAVRADSSSSSSSSSSMLEAAEQAVADAHLARYGPLSQEQLAQLAEYNRTLYV